MHGYRAVRPRLHGFAAGALPQYTPRPLSTGPVHPPPPFLASDPSTSTPAIDSAASEADGSRVWLPELVERYARFLPPNEVALTLRLVCRATASQFRGGQHTIIRLSQPCPPAEFAAHWADVQWLRALPGLRRRQLLQLTAAAGVPDNLWLLLQTHPEHCPLALDVIVAAAEAGQAHLVPPLLELYAHQQLPQPQDIDDAAAGLGPRHGVAGAAAAADPPHVIDVGGAGLPACELLPVLRAAAAAGERPLLQWLLELLAAPPATAPAVAGTPQGHVGHGQGRAARNGAGAAGPSTSRSGGGNAPCSACCDRGGSSSSSDDAGARPACDSSGRRGRATTRHDYASLAAAYQAAAGAAADGGQEELLCWLVAHTPATTSLAESVSRGITAAAVQPPALPRRLLERLLVAVAGGSGNAGSLRRLLLAWLQHSPPPPQLAAPPDGGEAPVNPGGTTPEAAGLARLSTQHASPNHGAHRPHAGTGAAATLPAGPPPPALAAHPLSSSDVSMLLRMVAAAAASRAADWRDKVQLLESYLPPPPPPLAPPEPGLGSRAVHTAGTGASRPQGRGSDGGGAGGRSSSRTGAITTSLAINAAVSAPDGAERLRWLLNRSREDGDEDPLPHMTHAAKMPPASLGRDSGARSDSGDSGSGRDVRASEEGLHGVSDAAAAIGSGPPPAPVAPRREACRGPQAPVVVHVPDTVSLLDAARCGAVGVLGLLLPALDSAAAQAAEEEGLAEGRERTLQLMQVLAASEGRICFLQEMAAAGLQVPASPDVLVAACGSGRVEAVRWLLEHMHKRPGDPASPLAPHLGTELRRDCAVAAASSGAVEVLELLRDAGMLVDLQPPHPHQQQHLQRQRQRQQQQQQQEQQELPHGAEAGGARAYGSDAATLPGQGGAVVASSDAAPGSAGSPAGCIRPNSGPQGDGGSPAAGNDGATARADNPSTEGDPRGPGGSESGRDCGPPAWGPELLLAAAMSGCEAAVEWAVAHGCPVVDDGEPYEQVAGEEPLCLPVLRLLRRLGHGWGAPNRVFRAVLAPRYQPPLCRTPATLRLAALRWLLDSGCPVEWEWAVRVAQQPQPLLAGALADTVARWVLREAAARGFEVAPRLELRHADGG